MNKLTKKEQQEHVNLTIGRLKERIRFISGYKPSKDTARAMQLIEKISDYVNEQEHYEAIDQMRLDEIMEQEEMEKRWFTTPLENLK